MGDVRAEGRDFVVETKHAGFKPSTGQPKQAMDGMANEIQMYLILVFSSQLLLWGRLVLWQNTARISENCGRKYT